MGPLRSVREGLLSRYGRKHGLLRTKWAQLQLEWGKYDALTAIDWPSVRRVIFVCRGNSCRSPYAEMRARVLGGRASSFGLETGGGRPANATAVRLAWARGLDLRAHRSRGYWSTRLGPADLLAVMEPGQVPGVLALAGPSRAQATLLGLFARPAFPHIEDPYGSCDAYFSTCFAILDSAVEGLLEKLGARAAESALAGPGP